MPDSATTRYIEEPVPPPNYNLLDVVDLGVWVRAAIDPDDAFASRVIAAASLIVRETAAHPEWTFETVPDRARLIAIQLAKRAYTNPDATTSSNVGPIGERTVEEFARTLELTSAERAVLEQYAIEAGAVDSGEGKLFTIQTENRPVRTGGYVLLPTEQDGASPVLYANEGDTGF